MYRTFAKRTKMTALPLMVVVLAGCNGIYDASVEGLVTLDGDPVPAGVISFVPASGGPPGYARSDESGKYEVFTGSEVGIPSGEYAVTVVAREKPEETHTELGSPNPGKQITPPWYKSTQSSPLSFSVEPGSNDIDLVLSSDPPSDWKPKKKRK